MQKRAKVENLSGNYLGLELDGVHVWLGYGDDEIGALMVVIDTPEDSNVHEKMIVYMNDAKAVTWE